MVPGAGAGVLGKRDAIPGELGLKYGELVASLRPLGSAIVAFSGGVDSAFLLRAAVDALGGRVRAVLGASPSVPEEVLDRARRVADRLDVQLEVRPSGEMDKPDYVANGPDRCYHCKSALYDLLLALAAGAEGAAVLDGTNADDLADIRPGLQAIRERGVLSPLAERGWRKAEIREASRVLGLETWDRPASPCLSSRIPHGLPVTVEALGRIETAERGLRSLGFGEVRVRHHGDLARIEVPLDRMGELVRRREEALSLVHEAGYRQVTIDLAGYRMGGAGDARSGDETPSGAPNAPQD